jgi:anaphase-promoting complex subunit 3
LAEQYGSDVGLAFWLLGELNSQLNQSREAARFFKAALKYNPFLWTAYQSLCEMGEALPLSLPLSPSF